MDIYTRIYGDVNFNPRQVEVNEELLELLIQIEMLFFTKKREVLGQHSLGMNLEELIYTLNASASNIEQLVDTQIKQYCPLASKYNIKVSCNFSKGTTRDIGVIDIYVDNRLLLGIII